MKRINIELSDEDYQILQSLAGKHGTVTQAIRDSIRLRSRLWQRQDEGARMLLEDAAGVREVVVL